MAANRLLITGATGFVGKWTLRHWRAVHPEVEIWATSDRPDDISRWADRFSLLDLRDGAAVAEFIRACRPTQVIHLAGLVANAPLADHLAVNVVGTEHLYDSLAALARADEIRIVQAGTAAMYGAVAPEEVPVAENNRLRPLTAYALSKITQDYLGEMFWRTRGLAVLRARIFNLLGPGQPQHLVPATFIQQLRALGETREAQSAEPAALAASPGTLGAIRVGTLACRRDFVDVRDVVWAFDRLLAGGRPGAAYNVGSGASVAIHEVLQELLEISGRHGVGVKEESARVRKNDVADVYADTTAITSDTNWRPRISLRESLAAMWHEDQP
jgi:GDP-4-dehydro-6-deoxy-D-mannose reductase